MLPISVFSLFDGARKKNSEKKEFFYWMIITIVLSSFNPMFLETLCRSSERVSLLGGEGGGGKQTEIVF
jgi:hypothetical protein